MGSVSNLKATRILMTKNYDANVHFEGRPIWNKF